MKAVKLILGVVSAATICMIAGCSAAETFVNPGDYLGGGGEVSSVPQATDSENAASAEAAASSVDASDYADEVPEGATQISGKYTIDEPGEYYVSGESEGKITIECEGVTLYLCNATITNEKKVIESDYGLTLTLIGENSVENTNKDGSNAIDCAGDLIINGSGSLDLSSTKNGIKGNSISVVGATLNITAEKDGLHAEVDAYDDATEQPTPSYDDGGYVYISGAAVNIDSEDDGIQADTFVFITDESDIDITAGGGAPANVTETSSDNASGKGIKAGMIDWGANGDDLEWDGYLVYIDGGTVTIDSNNDALHSNGEMVMTGGTIYLESGDDAMHADELMQISGGTIDIDKCYEGIEAAKVEISGGTIEVESYEDGINAADGTSTATGQANSNCHIIISGGYISVNCIGSEGDGIDSNGSILISGGELYIAGSSNSADAALDADGGIVINGGYVFAVGALGMVETPSTSSEQYCVSFARSQAISAGTTLYLCDSDENEIMYFVTPRSCQSVIISCPEFESGATYYIYGGDSLLSSFTISSTITTVGSSSSIGNPTGTPGGNFNQGGHGFGRK